MLSTVMETRCDIVAIYCQRYLPCSCMYLVYYHTRILTRSCHVYASLARGSCQDTWHDSLQDAHPFMPRYLACILAWSCQNMHDQKPSPAWPCQDTWHDSWQDAYMIWPRWMPRYLVWILAWYGKNMHASMSIQARFGMDLFQNTARSLQDI